MYNEVTHDPVLSGRYQFWFFQYNTGQPVLYSAMLLRRALRSLLNEIDPQSEDDALRRMVVVGHSQGGLLTKLVTINSGNRFGRISRRSRLKRSKWLPKLASSCVKECFSNLCVLLNG